MHALLLHHPTSGGLPSEIEILKFTERKESEQTALSPKRTRHYANYLKYALGDSSRMIYARIRIEIQTIFNGFLNSWDSLEVFFAKSDKFPLWTAREVFWWILSIKEEPYRTVSGRCLMCNWTLHMRDMQPSKRIFNISWPVYLPSTHFICENFINSDRIEPDTVIPSTDSLLILDCCWSIL